MKSHTNIMNRAFVLSAALVVTLFTHQANATSITIDEDSAARFVFSIDWAAVGNDALFPVPNTVNVFDFITDLAVETFNAFSPDAFTVNLDPSRDFAALLGFGGTSFTVDGDGLGGQFVYGAALPAGVPDGGTTLGMLGLAGAGLLGLRRKLAN